MRGLEGAQALLEAEEAVDDPLPMARSLRLHQLRLARELAEIRAAQLRLTQDKTHQLLAAAGITLPDPVVAALRQRTEGWPPGCGWLPWPDTLPRTARHRALAHATWSTWAQRSLG
jgi:hypothetical protein